MPQDDDKPHDRYLPIANVSRIMKRGLPTNAKIAKDAKECVQDCVSEFIAFVTSEASDRCAQEKRKTINGEDVLWALQSLGFENYTDVLKVYLQKYRESLKNEKPNKDDPVGPDYLSQMQAMAQIVQQQQQMAQIQQNEQYNSFQ